MENLGTLDILFLLLDIYPEKSAWYYFFPGQILMLQGPYAWSTNSVTNGTLALL